MRRLVSAGLMGMLAAMTLGIGPVFGACDPGRPFNQHSTDYYLRMDVNSTDFVGTQGTLDIQIPFVEPGGSNTQPRLRLYGSDAGQENGLIQAFVSLVYYPGQGSLGATGIRIYVSNEFGTGTSWDNTLSIASYESAYGIDIDGDAKSY